MVESMDKTLNPINQNVFTAGPLIELLTPESARSTVAMVPGIKYKDTNDNYQAVDNKLKGHSPTQVITSDSIKQIEITAPGQNPRYFKQIAKADDAHKPMAGLQPTGFKAIAWMETNAAGEPSLNKDGKANVTLTFAGYDGHPFDNSPQTKSMYAVGEDKRCPQIDAVPEFLKDAQAAIAKEGVAADINIASHSMGAANALKAAAELEGTDNKAQSVLLLEPLSASLAVKKLKETGEVDNEKMKAVIAKTTSVRTIRKNEDGNLVHTKTAMLQTNKLNENISSFMQSKPRIGDIDPNNEMVGTQLLMNVTGQKTFGTSAAAAADGDHVVGTLTNAARNGATIETPEKIKEAAPQMVGSKQPENTTQGRAFNWMERIMAALGGGKGMENPLGLLASVVEAALSAGGMLQQMQVAFSNASEMLQGKQNIPQVGNNNSRGIT